MKRLGRTWKRLHQWVYLAALLVIVHYVWLVKSDIREPLAYGAIVVALLLMRVPVIRRAASSFRNRTRSGQRSNAPRQVGNSDKLTP
jgi:sulfoxide reductase heme-binding subunit YedZ